MGCPDHSWGRVQRGRGAGLGFTLLHPTLPLVHLCVRGSNDGADVCRGNSEWRGLPNMSPMQPSRDSPEAQWTSCGRPSRGQASLRVREITVETS